MHDGLVTRDVLARAMEFTKTADGIQRELDRMKREEPVLYGEAMLTVRAIRGVLLPSGCSEEDLLSAAHGIRLLLARMYCALKLGVYGVWLDVDPVGDALLMRRPRHGNGREGRPKQGRGSSPARGEPDSTDGSYL